MRVFVGLAVFGLLIVVLAEAVLRTTGQGSLRGAEEIGNLCAFWAYFVGLALASLRGTHITGGIISIWVGERQLAVMRRVFALLCAAICIYILWQSLAYFEFITRFARKSTALRWPSTIWYASLLAGMSLGSIGFVLSAMRGASQGVHDDE